MGSTRGNRTKSRRRPLKICGSSIISISCTAYRKCKENKGPLGSITRKLATQATSIPPIFYVIQYKILAMITSADNHILSLESKMETIFPPSHHVFQKMDQLFGVVEILPKKFDYAINKLPAYLNKASIIDWALVHIISCLKFMIDVMSRLRSQNPNRDHDITWNDKNSCRESVKRSRDGSGDTARSVGVKTSPKLPRGTYKEVLEKGGRKSNQDEMKKWLEETAAAFSEENFKSKNGGLDSRWSMNPVNISRRCSDSGNLVRSISCTLIISQI